MNSWPKSVKPSVLHEGIERKRSSNWSKEWNTVKIDIDEEEGKFKKRKFGSGWFSGDTLKKDKRVQDVGVPSTVENNLFLFSLGNNPVDIGEIEEKRTENMKYAKSQVQLPIDPWEVSHCPSWHARRLQRCKLATAKPQGKHIIFEV